MAKKPPSNPLFAGGSTSFSVADSFGITATLPSVTNAEAEEDSFVGGGGASNANNFVGGGLNSSMASIGPPVTPKANLGPPAPVPTPSMFTSPISFFRSSPAPGGDSDPFSQISSGQPEATNSPQSVSLTAATSPPAPQPPLQTPMPPPVVSLQEATPLGATQPPAPQLFMPPAATPVTPAPGGSSSLKRPTYAPTPFINNSTTPGPSTFSPNPASQTPNLSGIPGLPPLPEPKTIQHVSTPMSSYAPSPASSIPPQLPPSQSAPNLVGMSSPYGAVGVSNEVTAHWFYKSRGDQDVWKPFSVEDSTAIDMSYEAGKKSDPIAVDGTRYDAYIDKRVKVPVYWPGQEMEIRRCSWFRRRDPEGRWIPYDEVTADKLEKEYQRASSSGQWQVKVVFDSGEWVMFHSPEVMMHFPTSSTSHGALDDWGQVQPQTDPSLRPQVVHRGLDGLPDIADGETVEVDHVFFVVHGIGAACDIKFRPLEEVVDGFRDLTADMSEKHFAGAHLASKANRVEFLPVHWHDKLHGEDAGTDSRIQPLTLRSIPKLRSFVNDTLLDVLFYTSPLYCQTILDTVCGEINRIFKLFSSRNPGFIAKLLLFVSYSLIFTFYYYLIGFKGDCSVIGHSLGSLILFDLLSGQTSISEDVSKDETTEASSDQDQDPPIPRWEKDLGIEDVFNKLEISEHLPAFTDQGIGIAELETCTEDDLKEAGLPLGPRKRLLSYLTKRTKRKSGFDEFQASSVARQVSYNVS